MSADKGCGCGCSDDSKTLNITSRPEQDAATAQVQVQITGMTCGHCVSSVTEELNELPAVTSVDVDLVANGTSTATITSSAALDEAAIREAISEAGYDVQSISR